MATWSIPVSAPAEMCSELRPVRAENPLRKADTASGQRNALDHRTLDLIAQPRAGQPRRRLSRRGHPDR